MVSGTKKQKCNTERIRSKYKKESLTPILKQCHFKNPRVSFLGRSVSVDFQIPCYEKGPKQGKKPRVALEFFV